MPRRGSRGALALVAIIACLLVAAGLSHALAQGTPFGAPRPAPVPSHDGLFGWVMGKQAEFYQSFTRLVRAAKADGSALWTLFGVAFLYGAFHAAGPGHGKAVISSYLVANQETWRRGVALSFISAMLQALVAVLIVGIGAALLGATSWVMCRTADIIELVSYALIAAVGVWLLWVKGRGFVGALTMLRPRPMSVGAAATGDHHHHHGSHNHAHHHHAHDHDDHHGHSHGPEPEQLAGAGGWRRGLAAVFAVGLRPCSGALVLLVFALAQGLFWGGVVAVFIMGLGTAITVAVIATLAVTARALASRLAAGRSGYGTLALKGLEVGAAILVLALGVLLLAGYLVTERLAFC